MQQTYFADAWYFIALLDPREADHRNARRLTKFTARVRLLTHEAVLNDHHFRQEGFTILSDAP